MSKICEKGIGQEEVFLVVAPPWQTKMPPLGLAYISSFLKSHGVAVRLCDLNVKIFNQSPPGKKNLWDISTINSYAPAQLADKFIFLFKKELDDFVDEACSSRARVIGFSTTIASLCVAVYMAHRIKEKNPSIVVALGGPGAYWNTCDIDPEKIIDIFVIGEGELPMLEIIRRLRGKQDKASLMGIQGTVVLKDRGYAEFLPANPVKDIDTIPSPDFSEFNIEDYNKQENYKPLPVLLSRGCINKCSFCADRKLNFPFRARDPYKVVEDIRYYKEHYAVTFFEFNDLLCNGNLKQLEKFCDLLIESKLGIKWTSYAAIREGMLPVLFKKMALSGCRCLCYGMESGSDIVLDKMNKSYNSQTAEDVIKNTHRAGIYTAINIILGYPGETNREFKQTSLFIERNKEYIDQVTNVSTCFFMPETDLIMDYKSRGVYFRKTLKDHFNKFFYKKEFILDFRKFYVGRDNSPRERVRRMRKMLKLLYRLEVPFTVVNYVKEHDKSLEKFIRDCDKNLNNLLLFGKNIKIDFIVSGKVQIYFKGKKITQDVGMNTSFFDGLKWTDSSSGKWSVKTNKRLSRVQLNIDWDDFPVSQEWRISVTGDNLLWEAISCFNGDITLYQHKSGIMLSDQYKCYQSKTGRQYFTQADEAWQDLCICDSNSISFFGEPVMPAVKLSRIYPENEYFQVQNAPGALSARMISLCPAAKADNAAGNLQAGIFRKGDSIKKTIKLCIKA